MSTIAISNSSAVLENPELLPSDFVNYLDYVQMVFSALLAPPLGIMLVLGLIGGFIFYDWAFFAAFPVSAIAYYLLAARERAVRNL